MGKRKDIVFHIPVSNEAKEKSLFNTDKPSKKRSRKKIYSTGKKRLTYYKKKPA
jgi:hypothetical protein